MRRTWSAALVAAVLVGSTEQLAAEEWARNFAVWHQANEMRCFGSANSAELAWWESYLLQAYMSMYEATQDRLWLERFTAHADTMLAMMRDVPDSGQCWPGYRDGFLGWGTTRYDPEGRYQEYMVHDAHICLPVVRFVRLVFSRQELQPQYMACVQRYVRVVEQNVIGKWRASWYADRGTGECLERFGGWEFLPANQFLVFGEVLLVMAEVAKSPCYRATWPDLSADWYLNTAEAMGARLRQGLRFRARDSSYIWGHWPETVPDPRPEDLSHANLVISFVLEALGQGRGFTPEDMTRFGNTLSRTMRVATGTASGFTCFVDGSGGPDHSGHLKDWLKLGDFHPAVFGLVRQAYGACPEWSAPAAHASQAATLAALAAVSARILTGRGDGTATSAGEEPVLQVEPKRAIVSGGRIVLEHKDEFTARVYDVHGRQVRVLPCVPAGKRGFRVEWHGEDEAGRSVRSGSYFCALVSADTTRRIRLTVLR